MHRRVLVFLFTVPLLLIIAVSQAHIKTDISSFFVSAGSAQAALVASNMQTGELSRRYVLSIGQPPNEKKSFEFIEKFRKNLVLIPGIRRVWGKKLTQNEISKLVSFYLPYHYNLYSLQPDVEVPALFSGPAIAQRAELIRQGLLSPEAQLVKTIIAKDPMFLMSHWLRHHPTNQKRNSRYASLVVETSAAGLDTTRQKLIFHQIKNTFNHINIEYGNRYTLDMTGVPLFAMAIQEQTSKDVMRVSTISMLVMLLLFIFLFRSLRALIIVSLTLVVAASVATIVTSAIFGQIYALTLALGTTLIGICVDYPIHVMVHAADGAGQALESTRRIWPSLLLGAITTMVGYAALSFTGYPGMQQIALYAGSAILTALCVARFILPYAIDQAVKPMTPAFSSNAWLKFASGSNLKWPIMILGTAVLLFGFAGIDWDNDLSRLSPSLENLKHKDRVIRSRMQSIDPGRFILIHADNMEHALQINEATSRVLEKVKTKGDLDAYYSVYPWIASQALQQKNIRAFSKQLTSKNIKRWRQALEKAGIRSAYLPTPAIPSIPALRLQNVVRSSAGRYISGQHATANNEAILTIWLGKHDEKAVRRALGTIGQAQYVSQKNVINELNSSYASKTIKALIYGGLIILLLVTLRYRSLTSALQALAPAIFSTAIVLGSWGISGQPFGMLNLLGMLLSIAICVDYGIFFLENRVLNTELTYQAIVISALTTIVAFSCLGLAESPVLQTLAWTIAPGVFLGSFLCPLLIRPKIACGAIIGTEQS